MVRAWAAEPDCTGCRGVVDARRSSPLRQTSYKDERLKAEPLHDQALPSLFRLRWSATRPCIPFLCRPSLVTMLSEAVITAQAMYVTPYPLNSRMSDCLTVC